MLTLNVKRSMTSFPPRDMYIRSMYYKRKITSTCEKYNINFKLQIFYVDACNKSVRILEEIDVKQALCTSFFNRPYNLLKMILET